VCSMQETQGGALFISHGLPKGRYAFALTSSSHGEELPRSDAGISASIPPLGNSEANPPEPYPNESSPWRSSSEIWTPQSIVGIALDP
jgi:hypothetical protein